VITAPALEYLFPLPALYAAAGRVLPEFEIVDAHALSPAAHRLLVHSGDMTSKLEEFFGEGMRLRILQCEHTPEHYRREVVLFGGKTGISVEYGAIEINLSAFSEALRSEIVTGILPLGGLLNRHGIRYRSEPRCFLRVTPCERLIEYFHLTGPEVLYARSNRLLDAEGVELARIVEVLRPV
jgi:chorismate-pyruvate lyase